jgi:hypothetical protein
LTGGIVFAARKRLGLTVRDLLVLPAVDLWGFLVLVISGFALLLRFFCPMPWSTCSSSDMTA